MEKKILQQFDSDISLNMQNLSKDSMFEDLMKKNGFAISENNNYRSYYYNKLTKKFEKPSYEKDDTNFFEEKKDEIDEEKYYLINKKILETRFGKKNLNMSWKNKNQKTKKNKLMMMMKKKIHQMEFFLTLL
jgi:hypothetical protein